MKKRILYLCENTGAPLPSWFSSIGVKDVLRVKVSDLARVKKVISTFQVIVAIASVSVRDQLNAYNGQLPPVFYLYKDKSDRDLQPYRRVWPGGIQDATLAPIIRRLLNGVSAS